MSELVYFVVHDSVSNKFQHFHAELPYKGMYQNLRDTSFMHTSDKGEPF